MAKFFADRVEKGKNGFKFSDVPDELKSDVATILIDRGREDLLEGWKSIG